MSASDRLLNRLCWLAMISLAIGLNLLPVFLTTLSTEYGGAGGLTREQMGRLGALLFGGLVVSILVTGPLVDRRGPKLFTQLGNALNAVGLVAAAFAPNYALLGAAMFVLGLGVGMLDMVLSPVVAALNPARRAAAMNWLHSFYGVGAVITIGIGTLTLRAGWGWRETCLLLALVPVGVLLAFAPMRFPRLNRPGTRLQLRKLVRRKWFLLALGAILLGGATEAGIGQWLPAYAQVSLHYPAWMGGVALLGLSVAVAAGRMLVGVLGGRRSPYTIMVWSCGLTVPLFLAGSFLPVPGLALTACVAVGLAGSCLWPTMLAVSADEYPDGGASMFGALGAAGNVGGVVMPWMVGVVADYADLHWGLAITALAPALMLPLVLSLQKKSRAATESCA